MNWGSNFKIPSVPFFCEVKVGVLKKLMCSNVEIRCIAIRNDGDNKLWFILHGLKPRSLDSKQSANIPVIVPNNDLFKGFIKLKDNLLSK